MEEIIGIGTGIGAVGAEKLENVNESLIGNLINEIAGLIEENLQLNQRIKEMKSPYESSLILVQQKRLMELSAEILVHIVNHKSFQPPQH